MKVKKIVWFLLIVQILSVSLILATSATSTNALAITLETNASKVNAAGESVYQAGEEIELTVAIAQNPGFKATIIEVSYDASALTFVEPENGTYESDFLVADANQTVLLVNKQSDGKIKVTIGDLMGAFYNPNAPVYDQTGRVVTLTFKLADDYAGGSLGITANVQNGMILDVNGATNNVEIDRPGTDADGNPVAGLAPVMGINPETHVHTFADATCTLPSTCTVCAETTGEALGHAYGDLIAEVPATCENDGTLAHYHCSACEKDFDAEKNELSDLTIPAKGHNYGDLIAKVDATCTEAGNVAHYTCSDCGKHFDEEKVELAEVVIPANGHNYGDLIAKVDATCTEDGVKAHYTCSVCGTHFDENKGVLESIVISANGHAYGELVPNVVPTCETAGVKTHYTCSVCHKYFDENKAEITDIAIPAKGHTYGDLIAKVDATCTEAGNVAHYTCSVCGKHFDEEKFELADIVIPATGHNYGDLVAKVDATCTADGVKAHYTCSACGKHFDEDKAVLTDIVIPAKGHTFVDVPAIEATKEETGMTAGKKCSVCNAVLEGMEETPKLESGCGGCNGGCGSLIGVSGVLMTMSVIGAAVLLKKKED